MKRLLFASLLLAGLPPALVAQSAAPAADAPARFLASAYKDWQTGPDGVAWLNLVGDSLAPTGLSAYRLRYPANVGKDSSRATVHFHMGTQQITVLKGTLVVGFGEDRDFAVVREYGPEGFVVIPSGRPHYHWTRGETEIHVEAFGPSATVPWPKIERPIGAPPPPPPPVDSTHVWKNGLPEWTVNPNGSARMNLAGGRPPSHSELFAYRTHRPVRVTADTTRMIYHYHFGTEHILILKGIVRFGIGEQADRSKALAYGPGSFIENPAGAKHFEWFVGDQMSQVHAVGSLAAIPLDPATGKPLTALPQR